MSHMLFVAIPMNDIHMHTLTNTLIHMHNEEHVLLNGTHMHTSTNMLMHMYNAEHIHMHYTLMHTHTLMQTHNPMHINV